MAKSQETFNKKEKEKKRLKKRKEKMEKRQERKENAKSSSLDDMIAYVDENGQLTDTPPDPTKKKKKIIAENIEIGVPKSEAVEVPTVRTGVVDFYNDEKGFGFIKEIGTGEKFFYHINGVLEEVVEGNKVSFELEQGMKGLNAVKVQPVK